MENLLDFTVLLSVYNKESPNYLDLSLESIWDKQSLKPNQIVLVQDGPLTLSLYSVIEKWKSKLNDVLTLVPLKENVGLAAALNEGLKYCKYEIIARMDTDDIALPNRFEQQISFLKANPHIAVCSGQIIEYSEDLTIKLSSRKVPLEHNEIKKFAKKRNPISHPCVAFKKSSVLSVGGYPSIYPEDYPLWILMLQKGYQFANIPQTLVKMRVGDALTNRRGFKFLKGEIQIFKHMLEIGFINKKEYYINIIQRSFLRLAPHSIKKFLYKSIR